MPRLALFTWICLVIMAGSARAGSLSPGDTYAYEIVTGDGTVLHPVVTFLSAREQVDGAGRRVRRAVTGSRVFDKGVNFDPHNGEFPNLGGLRYGISWQAGMEAWRDGGPRVRLVRDCAVTDRTNLEAAGMIFAGALRVDCDWSRPGEAPFRHDRSWYWQDDRGFQILVRAIQTGADIGTVEVRLTGITSESFGTP